MHWQSHFQAVSASPVRTRAHPATASFGASTAAPSPAPSELDFSQVPQSLLWAMAFAGAAAIGAAMYNLGQTLERERHVAHYQGAVRQAEADKTARIEARDRALREKAMRQAMMRVPQQQASHTREVRRTVRAA
jgi:hypothetical protein